MPCSGFSVNYRYFLNRDENLSRSDQLTILGRYHRTKLWRYLWCRCEAHWIQAQLCLFTVEICFTFLNEHFRNIAPGTVHLLYKSVNAIYFDFDACVYVFLFFAIFSLLLFSWIASQARSICPELPLLDGVNVPGIRISSCFFARTEPLGGTTAHGLVNMTHQRLGHRGLGVLHGCARSRWLGCSFRKGQGARSCWGARIGFEEYHIKSHILQTHPHKAA